MITTSGIDETTRVWDVKTGKEVMRPLKHEGGVWYSVFSPDQTKIATLTAFNDVWVWGARNKILLNHPTRQTGEILGISFSDVKRLYTLNNITHFFVFWVGYL